MLAALRTIIGLMLVLMCGSIVLFIYTSTAYYQADAKTHSTWLFVLLALLQLFGYGFVLLLVSLIVIGYKCIRHHALTVRHMVAGLVFIVFASSILLDMHFTGDIIGTQSGGGTIGQLMTNALSDLLSVDMLTLLGTALLAYGLILITRIPILRIFDDIGFIILNYKKETAKAIFLSYFQPDQSTRNTNYTESRTERHSSVPGTMQEDTSNNHTPDIADMNARHTASSTDLFAYTQNSGFNEQTDQYPQPSTHVPTEHAPADQSTQPETERDNTQPEVTASEAHETNEHTNQPTNATIPPQYTQPDPATEENHGDATMPLVMQEDQCQHQQAHQQVADRTLSEPPAVIKSSPSATTMEPSPTQSQPHANPLPEATTLDTAATIPEVQTPAADADSIQPDTEKKKSELAVSHFQTADTLCLTNISTDNSKTHTNSDEYRLSLADDDSASDAFMLTGDSEVDLSQDASHSRSITLTADDTQIVSVPKELRETAYEQAHGYSMATQDAPNQRSHEDQAAPATDDSVYGNIDIDAALQNDMPALSDSVDASSDSSADTTNSGNDDSQDEKYLPLSHDNTDTTSYVVVKEANDLHTADYTDLSLLSNMIPTKKTKQKKAQQSPEKSTTESYAEPNIDLYNSNTQQSAYTDDTKQPRVAVNDIMPSHTASQEMQQPFIYANEFATDNQDGSYTREVKNAVQALMDDLAKTGTWEAEDNNEAMPHHSIADQPITIAWAKPTTDMLAATAAIDAVNTASLQHMAELVHDKLAEFGIDIEVKEMVMGPTVSLFSILPAPGVKVSRIQALDRDLARALSVKSVRIVDIIPGKPYIGIEVPNKTRTTVRLRDIVDHMQVQQAAPLEFALGKDIAGHIITANLMKMPHLLIAGTTGSGKSVGIHTILMSMLCLYTPQQLRLILVDPKMLELSFYRDIPHLYTPVISDMPKAIKAFDWCVGEMERRYQLMAAVNVRNIETLNEQIAQASKQPHSNDDPIVYVDGQQIHLSSQQHIPYVAVVIDEFADMVMTLGKKAEEAIVRLAQKARASGIHLVLATQRPSVDVITGLIKANVPSRLSFMVSSKVDSRTVLDESGAEQLLGHGDMLFMPVGETIPRRVQGAFVSEMEIDAICEHWRGQQQEAYDMVTLSRHDDNQDDDLDDLYPVVYELITGNNKVESISALQRRFSIGYNRAARILEQLESRGVVSPPSQSGRRQLLG